MSAEEKSRATIEYLITLKQKFPQVVIAQCLGYPEGVWSPDCPAPARADIDRFLGTLAQLARLAVDSGEPGVGVNVGMDLRGLADAAPVVGPKLQKSIDKAWSKATPLLGMDPSDANERLACLRALAMNEELSQRIRVALPDSKVVKREEPRGDCVVANALGPEYRGVVVTLTGRLRIPPELAPVVESAADSRQYVLESLAKQ